MRAFLIALLAWAGLPVFAVEVNELAPNFELVSSMGDVKLSDYRGKVLYLDFWASWCGPCKQSFPWLNDMQARYAAHGLRVVGINVDRKSADAQAFLRSTPANFDVAFDSLGLAPLAYAIKSMPTSVLIAPDGKVMHVHSGFTTEQRQQLEQEIRQALGL